MNKKDSLWLGTVVWFDAPQEGQGRIRVDGEPSQVRFSLAEQRSVRAGVYEPEFEYRSENSPTPKGGDKVLLSFEVEYDLEVVPKCRRTLRRVARAVVWMFADEYEAAAREIAERPVYEVVEYRLINGEPTSVNQQETFAVGTAQGLQYRFPRGAKNDPLAPEQRLLDLVTRRCWYQRMEDGSRKQCPDPRRLPPGFSAKPFVPVNEQGVPFASHAELQSLIRGCNPFGDRDSFRESVKASHDRTPYPEPVPA